MLTDLIHKRYKNPNNVFWCDLLRIVQDVKCAKCSLICMLYAFIPRPILLRYKKKNRLEQHYLVFLELLNTLEYCVPCCFNAKYRFPGQCIQVLRGCFRTVWNVTLSMITYDCFSLTACTCFMLQCNTNQAFLYWKKFTLYEHIFIILLNRYFS